MGKAFFEVFPTLKLNDELTKILSGAEITKVGANREKTSIRIYLLGRRLIYYDNIVSIQENIKKQLFPNQKMEVKMIEKYQLSSQYNLQTLFMEYRQSMEQEIRGYSVLLYNVFHTAKLEFPRDKVMTLCMEDTIIARERQRELIEFLEKVICERCGLDLLVECEFMEPKGRKQIEKTDLIIAQEIHNVAVRAGNAMAKQQTEEKKQVHQTKEEKTPAAPNSKTTKSSFLKCW